MSEPDPTLKDLVAALGRLREQAQPGTDGKQSSRAMAAEQLALEVDDIIRRWSSELASPEVPAPKKPAHQKHSKKKSEREKPAGASRQE
jgi:hypothetical protein